MVYQQHRSLEIGSIDFSNLDMDIRVRKPKDGDLEYEVKVWNLKADTWKEVEKDQPVEIQLGWDDGEIETVCFGKVGSKGRTFEPPNVQFEVKGVDESAYATHSKFSDRWKDRSPDQIASSIASTIGLSAQTVSISRPIDGIYSVSKERPAKHWLDELLDYAEQYTGIKWEWHAESGKLFFQPRGETVVDAPVLDYGKTLKSIGPKASEDDSAENQLEFTALCEPMITKGAYVQVEVEEYAGPYQVSAYEFRSNSVNGDHEVTGDLIPAEEVEA